MLLARYFLYVGGVLLTLVFTLDAWLTRTAGHGEIARQFARYPHSFRSEMAGAHRFRYHPSTIVPARLRSWKIASPVLDGHRRLVKEREREAFALMQPSDAKRLEPSEPARRELKPQRQRKIVKRHVDAAFGPRRAAAAVWLVWQHHLVMAPAILLRARGAMAKVQVSRENLCTEKAPARCRGQGSASPERTRSVTGRYWRPVTAEAVVQAHGDHIHVLADPVVEKSGSKRIDGRERIIGIAHEQVVVFNTERPVRCEAVLKSNTHGAAPAGRACRGQFKAGNVSRMLKRLLVTAAPPFT